MDITETQLKDLVAAVNGFWGGLVGGTVLQLAPELLRPVGRYQEIILAIFVIGVGPLLGLVKLPLKATTLSPFSG